MTPSDLKYHVEQNGREPHFFTRQTMKFFGDTMRNYGVRSATIWSNHYSDGVYSTDGVEREVWELFRRRPVKNGLSSSAYFDKNTFARVFPKA